MPRRCTNKIPDRGSYSESRHNARQPRLAVAEPPPALSSLLLSIIHQFPNPRHRSRHLLGTLQIARRLQHPNSIHREPHSLLDRDEHVGGGCSSILRLFFAEVGFQIVVVGFVGDAPKGESSLKAQEGRERPVPFQTWNQRPKARRLLQGNRSVSSCNRTAFWPVRRSIERSNCCTGASAKKESRRESHPAGVRSLRLVRRVKVIQNEGGKLVKLA